MKFVWCRGDLVLDLEKVRNFTIQMEPNKITLLAWFNDKESLFLNVFNNLSEAKKYLTDLLKIKEEEK